MPKINKFIENSMRQLCDICIAIFITLVRVRKVPTVEEPRETKVFVMISWFARFKNRFGKLQKHMKKSVEKGYAKNIGKSSNKSSKIDAKTIKKPSKNRCEKSNDF